MMCLYCHIELTGGVVPYCCLNHMLWQFYGTPPLYDEMMRARAARRPAEPDRDGIRTTTEMRVLNIQKNSQRRRRRE